MIEDVLAEINESIDALLSPRIFPDVVLPIIIAVGTIGAAISAALAAIAAKCSARASERSIKNSIVESILSARYSKHTYSTCIQLRGYFSKFGNCRSVMMDDFKKLRINSPGSDIDRQRCDFSHYFRKLFDLRFLSFLDDNEMVNYVNWSDLDMLLRIVFPLEVVVFTTIPGHPQVVPSTFKNEVFDYFRIIYRYLCKCKKLDESEISEKDKRQRLRQFGKARDREFKAYWRQRKDYQKSKKYS